MGYSNGINLHHKFSNVDMPHLLLESRCCLMMIFGDQQYFSSPPVIFQKRACNALWSHLLQITGAAWKPLCTAGFASIHPSCPHPISFTLFCPRFLFVFSIQFVSSSPFYPSFFSQYKLFSQPSLTIIGLLTIKTNPPESLLWNSKPSQGHHQGLNMADQSNVLVFSSEKLPSEGTRRVAQN